MSEKVKTLLVEDDGDFAFLISRLIEDDERLHFLGYAANSTEAAIMVAELVPQIVLMDLNLSGRDLDGIEAARGIRIRSSAKVLLLTSYEQPEIMVNASKKAFASGYVFKSDYHDLPDTIYMTAVSSTPQEGFIKEILLNELTPAERSVLRDIVEGTNTVLQASSLKTIANQKTSIFRKLGLKNTSELINVFRNWL